MKILLVAPTIKPEIRTSMLSMIPQQISLSRLPHFPAGDLCRKGGEKNVFDV
jgi:hypothetical protein